MLTQESKLSLIVLSINDVNISSIVSLKLIIFELIIEIAIDFLFLRFSEEYFMIDIVSF